ncbi:MAG: hypothetical protein JSR39_10020 [Verrucomicrobia bacterium]|nr:hypothetical protein [Verrucomicrobiota bacterium]
MLLQRWIDWQNVGKRGFAWMGLRTHEKAVSHYEGPVNLRNEKQVKRPWPRTGLRP